MQKILRDKEHTWRLRNRTERLIKMGSTALLGEDSRTYIRWGDCTGLRIRRMIFFSRNKNEKTKTNSNRARETTFNKHETAVNWTDSSKSSSKANITPRTWLPYWRIWIDGICMQNSELKFLQERKKTYGAKRDKMYTILKRGKHKKQHSLSLMVQPVYEIKKGIHPIYTLTHCRNTYIATYTLNKIYLTAETFA